VPHHDCTTFHAFRTRNVASTLVVFEGPCLGRVRNWQFSTLPTGIPANISSDTAYRIEHRPQRADALFSRFNRDTATSLAQRCLGMGCAYRSSTSMVPIRSRCACSSGAREARTSSCGAARERAEPRRTTSSEFCDPEVLDGDEDLIERYFLEPSRARPSRPTP
jgi:hypothetical protein